MTTVGIRCDAGPGVGVGHLVRCVALAEELLARGVSVHFLGDLGGVEFAEAQLRSRGLPRHPAPADAAALVADADRLGLDALVVDSYVVPPEHTAAVRAAGRTVLAVVDGDRRGLSADLFVDQNLGATGADLAGLRYALLRSAVRRLRPAAPRVHDASRPPRVVAFFGGTDAFRAAPGIARLLAGTAVPLGATIVAADAAMREELLAVRPAPGQSFEIIAPTARLPELLAGADLVVSASGTSTWELLCLGCAAALVWVVDNQRAGYERTVAQGCAAGLGRLGGLPPGAVGVLRGLLTDPGARTRLSARAWAAVDGRGPERVADALLARVAAARPAPVAGTRPA